MDGYGKGTIKASEAARYIPEGKIMSDLDELQEDFRLSDDFKDFTAEVYVRMKRKNFLSYREIKERFPAKSPWRDNFRWIGDSLESLINDRLVEFKPGIVDRFKKIDIAPKLKRLQKINQNNYLLLGSTWFIVFISG